MLKNPPADAEHMDWIHGQGSRIPKATEQLGLCTTTTESAL